MKNVEEIQIDADYGPQIVFVFQVDIFTHISGYCFKI